MYTHRSMLDPGLLCLFWIPNKLHWSQTTRVDYWSLTQSYHANTSGFSFIFFPTCQCAFVIVHFFLMCSRMQPFFISIQTKLYQRLELTIQHEISFVHLRIQRFSALRPRVVQTFDKKLAPTGSKHAYFLDLSLWGWCVSVCRRSGLYRSRVKWNQKREREKKSVESWPVFW